MSWDLNEGLNNTGGGGKKEFCKFPNGVTRIRVLDDVPHLRWSHWMPQFERSITCPGKGCPIDALNKNAKAQGMDYVYDQSRKWSLNVYNHETERLEIMEQGVTFMEDLKTVLTDLKEEGKDLKDVILKVRRRMGENKKTTWRIDIDSEVPMNDEEKKAMAERTDFKEYFKAPTVDQVRQLLAVTGNFKDEFVRITTGSSTEASESTEDFEVEED